MMSTRCLQLRSRRCWRLQPGHSQRSTVRAGSIRPVRRAIAYVTPYAGEPADLSPYAKFAAPYDLNYIHPNIYGGAGRDLDSPSRKI